MPYTEDQEYYFKLITLIYCIGANVNRELLQKFINSRNITLEQFINDHQHEIYHFFCQVTCCQCRTKPIPLNDSEVINRTQMQKLFEYSSNDRLENHKHGRTGQLCCLKASRNLELKDLDFTLIKVFLVKFCHQIFWDCLLENVGQTFSEFLEANVHKVYHLSVDVICCCMCNVDRDIPKKRINEAQFEIIYNKVRSPCRRFCSCQYGIQRDLTLSQLIRRDRNLTTELTRYFCSCRRCLEIIYENRCKIEHSSESSSTFLDIWRETSTNILEIARALNKYEQYASQLQQLQDYPTNSQVTSDALPIISSADSNETTLAEAIALSEELNEDDDQVPAEIKLMSDKKYVPLYLELLESGSEKKRDIRLVIVGKKGTGKTSLLKRLFGEKISNTETTSTNGIEIHRIRCNANCDDGIWNKLDGNSEDTDLHARLLKPYHESLKSKSEQAMEAAADAPAKQANKNTLETILQLYKSSVITNSLVNPPGDTDRQSKPPVDTEHLIKPHVSTTSHDQQPNLLLEQAYTDIETMLKSEVNLHDNEMYATLLLWDFAGDEEFYHTHQTFMSPDAIYLVVTKLNDVDDKEAQDLFRLWMDSIHCYSRLESENNKSEGNMKMPKDLDPPVVIIGTWKDAVTSKSTEIKEACRRNLLMFTEAMADDERRHIRDEVLISNTEDDNSVFQKLRLDILKLARTMKSWNKDYPLKFIQLEKRLQEKKKELPIITFDELKHISAETQNPLNEDELILYLKFHHEIRALVYFEDLPDYIILDTQWLSDAFKCIVTAKKFQTTCISIKNQKRWEEFHCKGKLHEEVLEDIFKGGQMLNEHKEHILNVMEKFDIIIRPIKSEKYSSDEKRCYYVPCMIKSVPECDIYKMFNVTENTCKKSTWLCFKFRFLPPHLMNHLIASLCREFEVAEVSFLENKNRRNTVQRVIALFRGTAVFELKRTSKLQKLLLTTCPNVILVQILEFGKKVIMERGMYKHIADFVTDEINKIISTRFKMTNVNFEKKWECGLTKPESVICSNDFSTKKIVEYYCEMCKTTHEFTDEWSNLQSKKICLSRGSEESSETNSKTETTSKNLNVSTNFKVRCFFKDEMRAFSNVSEQSTRTGSSTPLTLKEFNFAKMGMIVLNILTDVLYDLLKQDKAFLRPRSDCDITYLYSEHRRIDKHKPSNGWGGTWQTFQSTNVAVGDDIERIRLTRNEIFHSKKFKLNKKRYTDLCKILAELLKRSDQQNKPARHYTDYLNEIVAKAISAEDLKVVHHQIENEIKLERAIEVEIQHQVSVAPQ